MLYLLFLFTTIVITRIHAIDVYFDYNGTKINVCVNAKCGTTSMAEGLYEALTQEEYPESCFEQRKFVQAFSCGFNSIQTFDKLTNQTQDVDYALLVIRHPVHRAVSSWKSKVRPDICVASRDHHIDNLDRNKLYKRWNTDFVSFSQFVEDKMHQFKNEHWNPQFDLCQGPDNYDDVVQLEMINSTSFTSLSKALGVPFQVLHTHRSKQISNGRKLKSREKMIDATLERLYSFYSDDYEYYGFLQDLEEDAIFLSNEFVNYPHECL